MNEKTRGQVPIWKEWTCKILIAVKLTIPRIPKKVRQVSKAQNKMKEIKDNSHFSFNENRKFTRWGIRRVITYNLQI